jgi:hypothetical protein
MRTLLAAAAVVVLVAPAPASAARLTGKLKAPGHELIYLARDGAAKVVVPGAGGRFSAKVRAPRGASLHVTRAGSYAGPVLLGRKRVTLGAARKIRLGALRLRNGFATITGKVRTSGPKVRLDAKGRPRGAGKLGLVRIVAARAAQDTVLEGADSDRDGVANAFDADDDGDLVLDAVDGSGGRASGVSLSLSSALPLDLTESINANAGADGDVEATLEKYLRFLFSVSADEIGEATRVGVACAFEWCTGAEVVIPPGLGDSDTPWADADGDGLLDLPRNGPAFQRQIYPRTNTAGVAPGDTFTATSDSGVSAVAALSMYFTSSVAIRDLGSHTFTCPVAAGAQGTPGNPLPIDGKVRITLWRPQRAAIPGAEVGALRDIGGLQYGADMSGAFCRPEHFSDLSPTLTPGAPGGEAPLRDTAPDADPTGETLSFTVDAAACAAGGGDTGGGFPLLSVVAQDAYGDLTRQHIVVQFK